MFALNEEFSRSGVADQISTDCFNGENRPRQLQEWCAQRNIECPSKRAVAYHIIESGYEHSVADPAKRDELRSLHERICDSLGLER